MRRALILPVSAAVVGALLAIGVSVIDRSFDSSEPRVRVIRSADREQLAEFEVDLTRVERQVAEAIERIGEVRIDDDPRSESTIVVDLRAVAGRERAQELLGQIEAELEASRVEALTREDGSAHRRPSAN